MGKVLSLQALSKRIFVIRGQRVMLSPDLSELYEVETKVLMQAVKRNGARFPEDFMFQLGTDEWSRLRSQFVTLDARSVGGRGRYPKYRPYAFTEQGVAMLSSVLKSDRAIEVNVEIMRAFVRLRELLASNQDLARKLAELEKKYDAQFKVVFEAIRELMEPVDAVPPPRRIGFDPGTSGPADRRSSRTRPSREQRLRRS